MVVVGVKGEDKPVMNPRGTAEKSEVLVLVVVVGRLVC
jgi:hypothetical protein